VKQEFKESEGSPELKGRMRSLQYKAARRAGERASVAQTAEATAIITNPSHFAVALRYEPGQPGAPIIVAMGRDLVARDIRGVARRRAIPTLSAPPLARALYFAGGIGQEIPVDLYAVVATVLAHVWRLEQGLADPMPEIDLPETLRFDANGRRERPDEPDQRKGPKK
jgi:flagellar biosynthesis protein FlhB